MLSLAKAAKDYYLQKLGEISPREDYYLQGGTAAGRWVGSGAAELDLVGSVSAEWLVRLFDGEHPGTGEQLGRRIRKDGVAAWDVTFSADKSVSLLGALGDEQTRKEVLEAFEEATSQALGYLESVASATRGASKNRMVDGNGNPKYRVETWPIQTEGYLAAAFTEYRSRADDPQMHTHVVIANKVRGEDGVWRTIDGRLLYRHQLAAGYLHEAVLRKELTERLGVRWQSVHKGMADIEGFTRGQVEAFSRRREQLEEWRQGQGLSDTSAARQVAVLAARGPKRAHPLEELEVEWRQRAVEVGLTTEQITRIVGRDRRITQPDPNRLIEQLVSPEGLTAKVSTFGRAEVVKEIAAALPEGGTGSEIEALADSLLQQRDVVVMLPVGDTLGEPGLEQTDRPSDEPPLVSAMRRRDGRPFPGVAGERRYTTAELLATEQRVIQRALTGDGRRWTAPRRLVEASLRRRPELTEGQREMVRRFATSGAGIDVGVGPAGSGKTAVMAVLAELATITGTPILGAALAARAATGLQAATGIPSSSLAALINGIRDHGGLPRRVVVVVDEASMVGTRQLAALSDRVEEANGKAILIGDHHQLPEIEAGGLFHVLVNRHPAVELTENIRQRHEWERTALTQLRDGSMNQAVEAYRQHQRLIVGRNRDDTLAHAVHDWYRHVAAAGDLTSGLLIAHDNDTVAELNELARTHIATSGCLDGPAIQIGQRVFQSGDRVICLTNRREVGVHNGDLATVVGVDPDHRSLTVRLDRHREIRELPDWYLDGGHVDYGYALTGHKAQGVTVDRTFAVVDAGTTREWAYVAMSRGREANTAYLVCPETVEQCTHVAHLSRDDPVEMAVASLERSARQEPAIGLGVGLR